jgi:hypothetical protein
MRDFTRPPFAGTMLAFLLAVLPAGKLAGQLALTDAESALFGLPEEGRTP